MSCTPLIDGIDLAIVGNKSGELFDNALYCFFTDCVSDDEEGFIQCFVLFHYLHLLLDYDRMSGIR